MPNTQSFSVQSQQYYESIISRIRAAYLAQTYDIRENVNGVEYSRRAVERLLLDYISLGNVSLADRLIDEVSASDFSMPVGELSHNPVHQARYTIVAAVTMFSRTAIDSGLSEHLAYSISDSYICHADQMQNTEEIYYLFFRAFREYCQAVYQWRIQCSRPELHQCCEYVSEHLHEKITLADLGRITHLTPNYVSDLFQKELSIRPKQYILREKLNYAAFILRNTDTSIAEVSALLAFSSPSAFTGHFTVQFGLTPSRYRQESAYEKSAE